MWTAQHTSPTPRTSAKNLDLRTLSIKSHSSEPATTYPQPTEMWLGKHQRSLPSMSSDQYQYSVPSLSPRSSIAPDHEDDDISSQTSESTAFSATHSPEPGKRGAERVHVHILSGERYSPSLIDVDGGELDVGEGEADLKSPFVNGLDDEPGPGIHDSLVSFHVQEFGFVDRPRNAGGIPDSPPLTARPGAILNDHSEHNNNEQNSAIQQAGPTGPLSTQLNTLLSQITILESSTPSVMASDYTTLQNRLSSLEAKNATLLSNREALFSLRDEDVSNLIKVRTLLAQERRALESLRKLRDDDLQNVIELRNKLAQATWTNHSRSASPSVSAGSVNHRRMEKAQSLSASVSASSSSLNQSNDLWQTAKTAALEQKVLELESANADLRQKLERSAKPQKQSGTEMQIIPSSSAVATGGFEHQPGISALAELGLHAMRERESHKTEINDLEADNLRLRQQVEKMKYQLETSRAVIECFSQMLKSH